MIYIDLANNFEELRVTEDDDSQEIRSFVTTETLLEANFYKVSVSMGSESGQSIEVSYCETEGGIRKDQRSPPELWVTFAAVNVIVLLLIVGVNAVVWWKWRRVRNHLALPQENIEL